ncbi:hypothetical protein [Methanogenium cariaci]|uniref:hypothetical protein n=1 Tax=Methanogenium cariaci TaxID=2197 RepID=UPI001FE1DE51|nr:hypothetical protein [Methanogenium cariaci]
MMAEIYVTAFVAGPIAVIIMLVAQNMSGHNQMQSVMPLMYIGLPIGGNRYDYHPLYPAAPGQSGYYPE